MEEEEEEEEMEGGEEKGLNGTILPSSNFLTSRVRVPYRRDNGRFRWGECNRFILFRENFFFFCTRCSFYAIGFSPFSSTLDCSATTNQDHLTESTPHFVSNISLSLSRALKRTYTHNRVPFTPASPPIFLSLPFRTLFLVSRLFGFGPSRHPGLLRSPTNLFDKSFRLIGRTTRPRSFF